MIPIKVLYRLLMIGLIMLVYLGTSAQSTTVTIREAWSTPNSTTYWINEYPSTPKYVAPKVETTPPASHSNWRNVYVASQVRGDKQYEELLLTTVSLFYKSNKTSIEYNKLRQYAFEWSVLYNKPADERLREFYRFHFLHDVFGDKPAEITEPY